MKKDIASVVAAAMLALGVGGASSGCAVLDRARVNSAIEQRERSLNRDLEEIAKSVFCVRNTISYRRVGAGLDEKPVERTIYGTALAYASRDGKTYLVTNDHVANGDETYRTITLKPEAGRLTLTMNTYTKISDSLTLVDNKFDKVKSDDVAVTRVETDDKLDIAVLKSDRTLPVAGTYIRHDEVPPKEWDEVYVVGYPRGVMKARVKGTVTNSGLKLPDDGMVYHALDVTGTFGNSGSSYFFRKGQNLYWGGVIRALLPFHMSRSPMLGVPLKNFSGMLARHAYFPVGNTGGDTKK